MARKQRTNPEAEATVNPETATDNQSVEKSEAELANEQALKDAAAAQSEQKEEVPAPQEDVIPDGACEVYGQADPNSRACISCPALEQCKAKTAAAKVKPAKEKKEGTARTPRAAGDGTFSIFGHCRGGSQAAAIEAALVNPVTIAELAAMTGATASRVKAHINFLVTKHSDTCTMVKHEGGKIQFVLNK